MKAHRIYGVKNNIAYCHFPRGENVMREIKIQCYVKHKKMKTYFGKDFKCIGINKWSFCICLLYTSPSPRDRQKSRMPSSA